MRSAWNGGETRHARWDCAGIMHARAPRRNPFALHQTSCSGTKRRTGGQRCRNSRNSNAAPYQPEQPESPEKPVAVHRTSLQCPGA